MPSKEPERIHHDWDAALVAHCDFCSHSKMTVPHADGGRICASCCDSEFLSNWHNYARSLATELLSLREQLAELKLSIGFNVGDRVCDSVDKFGYGYVVSINNGRSEYPISVQFDKSDKGRIATYTADGRKLSGCPVCLYKIPSVTAAKPAED
ncbi:TPA: hypothetical protein SJ417_002593 [Yersinia enterocolitica]|nr:hypothetical protein [Yersinia enterocolitica]